MKPPVLSYTFLSTYWSCPKSAYHNYISKDLPRVESEAMRWGNRVHEAMDKRIKGSPLPEDMQKWEPMVAPLAVIPGVQSEQAVGLTREGTPTGFWDGDVWIRGKIDVLAVNGDRAFIADWKTGKKREDPTELQIFGLFVKELYPDVKVVIGRYVWLQDSSIGDVHDVSNEMPMYKKLYDAAYEVEKLIETGAEWIPRPNGLCRQWCPVLSCQHNGQRK